MADGEMGRMDRMGRMGRIRIGLRSRNTLFRIQRAEQPIGQYNNIETPVWICFISFSWIGGFPTWYISDAAIKCLTEHNNTSQLVETMLQPNPYPLFVVICRGHKRTYLCKWFLRRFFPHYAPGLLQHNTRIFPPSVTSPPLNH